MPRAESVSIDGEVLAFLLFLMLAAAALWITAVVLGFRWALRAGAGSRNAAILWGVAAVVVVAPGLLAGPNPLLLGALLVVGAQAACFFAVRRSGGPVAGRGGRYDTGGTGGTGGGNGGGNGNGGVGGTGGGATGGTTDPGHRP